MTTILASLLWISALSVVPAPSDPADALGEPLSDDEVKQAVRDYLANSPDAKELRWIAASGEGIEKKPVVHFKHLDTVKWGPWQVKLTTGEALLTTKKDDRIVDAVIRRKDGKAAIVKGKIWLNYSGRVSVTSLRPPMEK